MYSTSTGLINRQKCIVRPKKNVFLVKLFLQNLCGHAVFWGFFCFFLLSEIPDGEMRSEMVEKNGI
jgi:hypothetical protein